MTLIDQKTALEQVEDFVSDKSPASPEQLRTGHLTVPENTILVIYLLIEVPFKQNFHLKY